MTRTIFCVLLLVVATASIASAPAMAQENNSTLNGTDDELSPDDFDGEKRLYIDDNAYVADWEYEDGRHQITLGADEPTEAAIFDGGIRTDGSTSSSIQGESVELDGETARTRTIDSDNTVTILSSQSLDRIEAVRLDPPTDALIGGPWTAHDSRLSALGAGSAVGLMVVYKEIRRRFATGLEPRWLR